jgi:hypothetical protein
LILSLGISYSWSSDFWLAKILFMNLIMLRNMPFLLYLLSLETNVPIIIIIIIHCQLRTEVKGKTFLICFT